MILPVQVANLLINVRAGLFELIVRGSTIDFV